MKSMRYLAKKYSIALIVTMVTTLPAFGAHAQMVLQITDINVTSITDSKAVVRWTTNMPATARIDFGQDASYGIYLINGSEQRTDHEIDLQGLTPLTTYHFSVTSKAYTQEVSTFDRTFKTTKYIDTTIPQISNVHVAYVTATQATFQWQTDEPTSSIVRYGKTSAYTSQGGGGGLTTIHDVTIGRLTPANTYHFQVSSADAAGNKAVYNDQTFVTLFNTEPDTAPLTISEIRPLTLNDTQLGVDRVTISWTTNKLSTGVIHLGTTTRFSKTVSQVSLFREFQHSAAITELKPDTLYYFNLQSKDVFGTSLTSDTYSFKTRKVASSQVVAPTIPDQVLVLGFSTLDTTAAKALYRVKGNNDIYAIIAGQRYRMTGPKALARYSSGLTVKDVTQAQLDAYPSVHLVKASNGNTIYHLYRRPNNRILKLVIPSPSVFGSYPANRWNDIVSVASVELAQYPDAVVVHAQGDPTIYLLTNGLKHPFISERAFLSRGYVFSDVVDISSTHLNNYQTGSPLQ